MKLNTDQAELKVNIHAEPTSLAKTLQKNMDKELSLLRKLTKRYPGADLQIHLSKVARTGEHKVKMKLDLPRQKALVAGKDGPDLHPAYTQCLRNLVEQIKEIKDKRKK